MSNTITVLGSWVRTRREILLLFLVLALGSFLRIYGLGAESIWLDEAHSIRVSSQNFVSVITGAASGQQAPLYFVILHLWMGLLGNSEVAVRSLSVIFGVISILLIYQIGSTLFSRKVGLISSFLSAISLFHIHYSQEARPYSLLLFLSLLSFLFFIQILKQHKRWCYPCYLLANILLVYTHVFGLFIIAAQIFFFLLFWTTYKPQRLKYLSIQIATAVAILPLVFLLSPIAISMIEHGFWIPEPSLRSIYDTFETFAGDGILLVLVFFCLVVAAPPFLRRIRTKWALRKPLQSLKGISWNIRLEAIEEILLLVMWLSLPIVLAFIISKITAPIYYGGCARYLIGASPALYLLVAKGLSNLKLRSIIYPIILLIVLLALPNLMNYYTQYGKAQWRDVAQYVELNAQENDVLIFYPSSTQKCFDYYYKGDLDEFGIPRYEDDTEEIAALVNKATYGKWRLWLIFGRGTGSKPTETYLRDRYGNDSVIVERKFFVVRVLLFDLKEQGTGQ